MFIAAMLHAFPDFQAGMIAAIRAAGLPEDVAIAVQPFQDFALTGMRFVVTEPGETGAAFVSAGHDHGHRAFAHIRDELTNSNLDITIRGRANDIFTRLADVEGQIHGVPLDQVSFHELGGWDSIADIVGAAYLIERCSPATWSVGSLPKGSGLVKTAHGPLPVPSPATARLLEGFLWHDDGRPGERVTPTGAAILGHLHCASRVPASSRLVASGYGFGTRRFIGMSNTLRVLVMETEAQVGVSQDQVAVIEFELDDQTPEDIALAVDRMRNHVGVKDVLQMPAYGKKNRIYTHLQIICEPVMLDEIVRLCLSQTTTLGVRHHLVQRSILPRDQTTITHGGRAIKVKTAQRPEGDLTAKVESDDVARIDAPSFAQRNRLRQEIEALAIANKASNQDRDE